MRIDIHRGLNQIGGPITEISTKTSRVFIDMGENLPGVAGPVDEEEEREYVQSLLRRNVRPNEGIVYTHAHADHVGMWHLVPEGKDKMQHMSQGTRDMLKLKEETLAKGYGLAGFKELEQAGRRRLQRLGNVSVWTWDDDDRAFWVGDIKITPYQVSHSVYDASMLLIEAENKRLLHTGDFRMHGSMRNDIINIASSLSGTIDVLITEGTNLDSLEHAISEDEVGLRMEQSFKEYDYVFVLTSSTDIERLMQIEKAALGANRVFVTSSLLMHKTVEYFAELQSVRMPAVTHYKLSPGNLSRRLIFKMQREGFVMVVGTGQLEFVKQIRENFDPKRTLPVYSCWDGYYKDPEQAALNPKYLEFRQAFDNVIDIHTSGHADRAALAGVIAAANPKEAIIAIHKNPDATASSLAISDDLKRLIVPDSIQPDWISVK